MSYDVIVKIIADGAKAKAEFDRAGKAAERMAKKTEDEVQRAKISMEKYGRQAGVVGAAMIGAAGTVAFAMKGWVKSAQEAEMASMRLESSVKGAYGASSNAVKAFEDQAKAIQKVTVASDEDVMSIQALLAQFGLTQRQVTQLTPLVVDISRKWGIDYVGAAKAVAKAADGKATALKKLGINIDETKAKTDPYLATVEALRQAAGGFAQQEGKTFAGQTAILANQMDELKESLGRGVLSALNDVLPAVNGAAGAFTGLDDKTGGLIGRTAAIGVGFTALIGSLGLAYSAVVKLKTAYETASASSAKFAAAQTLAKGGAVAAIGVALGAALGGAINEQLYSFGEKGADGYKKALSSDNAKTITRGFLLAAESEAGKTGNILGGFIGGIGANLKAMFTGGDSVDILKNITGAGFDKAFQKIAASSPEAARGILNYVDSHKALRKALVDSGANLDEYRQRMKNTADANVDGKVTIEEVNAQLEEQAKAASDLIGLIGTQDAVTRGVAEANLSVVNAQRQLTDAQTAYNDAVKSGDPKKIAEAQATLEGALLTLAGAQDQARAAAFKHAEMLLALQDTAGDEEAFNQAVAQLERMKAILTDPAEKNAIQERIDALVLLRLTAGEKIDLNSGAVMESLWRLKAAGQITEEQLKKLTGGPDGWQLVVNTRPAADALRRFADEYKIPITDIAPNVRWEIANARATGGPVAGGTPYLVGEKGPELFVPTGNGMIVPNNRLNSIAGGAAGGITVNVSSSVLSTPAETGAAVVDALTAWSRRNGRLPAPLVA